MKEQTRMAKQQIDEVKSKYDTPLEAVKAKDLSELKRMKECGLWDPKKRDGHGFKILDLATRLKALNILKYLIEELGLDVNSRNPWGQTPLYSALGQRHGRIIRYLLNAGASTNTFPRIYSDFEYAILSGNLKQLKRLVAEGEDVHQGSQHWKDKPIHWAVSAGWLHIVQFLIKDCGIDTETPGEFRRTSLHVAALSDRLDITQWLVLEAGAVIYVQNDNRFTAVSGGRENSTRWLLTQPKCGMGVEDSNNKIKKLIYRVDRP